MPSLYIKEGEGAVQLPKSQVSCAIGDSQGQLSQKAHREFVSCCRAKILLETRQDDLGLGACLLTHTWASTSI